MDIFAAYATDETAENEGSWFDLGQGARLLVARAGNDAYAKLLTKLVNKHKKVLDGEDKAAEDKSREIMIEVMATTLLRGWEKLSFKGKPLEYTEANAKMLLGIKDFRAQVQKFAEDFDAFRFREEKAQGEA